MDPFPAGIDHVVVIGASAGGLEALQELLSQLLPGTKAAYIVAQHLAPDHPSQLADLLVRSTRLKVVLGRDGLPLDADQITVIPAGCDASLEVATLRLIHPEPRFGPSPSIDRLCESVAGQWLDRCVGVVLSGTGSDGACGLRAIAAAGGLTLVQKPETARFDGMPRAALALGRVDLVADPGTIGSRLSAWFTTRENNDACDDEDQLGDVVLLTSTIAQLKQSTGIDFSQYKDSTLRRQVQRRMAIRGAKTTDDYLQLLASDVNEAQSLAGNLLVTVTAFFRNPDAFAALASQLHALVSRRTTSERIRVWVPGCATGEEAYSIAMMISEVMGHPRDLSHRLKLFATDLDEHSLAIARRGVYPMSAAGMIPAPLFQRFAIGQDTEFELAKDLRSCIVFARHNICEDPPFPNIDLVSCRNTLIYFTMPLQERVIDMLSFSLQPDGLLFLGSSESLGRLSGFRIVNPGHRIYARTRDSRPRSRQPLAMPLQSPMPPHRSHQASPALRELVPEQHVRLLEALIRTLAEPCLVLDENHNLVEVVGDVSPYCRIPEGSMTTAAGAFLRDELQAEARALVLLVRADRRPASSASLHLPDETAPLRLEAIPLVLGERTLTVLSFIPERGDEATPVIGLGSTERDAAFAREIDRLERELLSSQDTLRRSMADLEQANEELEASSEELQASSEELQSSNEELEASNEELQATNEELSTLNQQLRTRSDELEHLNTDLENIQGSLSQGMVIVDRNLRITRFSPLAVRVFGLVESDVGQPLIGVPTTVPLPELREALLAVVNGEQRRSIEATSEEVSYLAQVMPYRDRLGLRLGAIITLTDVSEQVALRRAAEASLREFTTLADGLDQVVWKRDHSMARILYISQRIESLTGWSTAEVCANPSLLDQAIVAEDRELVAAARRQLRSGWTVTYRLTLPTGDQLALQEVATVLEDSHGRSVVGTLSDVTGLRRLERRNTLLACAFHAIQATETQPLAVLDDALTIITVSESFAACLALPVGDLVGRPIEAMASSLLPGSAEVARAAPATPAAATLREWAARELAGHQAPGPHDVRLQPPGQAGREARVEWLPLAQAADTLGLLMRLSLDSPC